MRPAARALLSAVAGLALLAGAAACGDDDDSASVGDTTTTSPAAAAGGDAGTSTGPETTVAGGEPLVGCERLDEQPDGVYQVAEAGEIELTFDGSTVALVEARPAEGWTATGDEEDDSDEVEVTFSQGDREIDFEAEIDDGRLEVDICVD